MISMKITIVGGGNIGTQFAVHCAAKGLDVTVYTSDPSVFETHLNIVDETDRTTCEGNILLASISLNFLNKFGIINTINKPTTNIFNRLTAVLITLLSILAPKETSVSVSVETLLFLYVSVAVIIASLLVTIFAS